MNSILDDYDWENVFAYANSEKGPRIGAIGDVSRTSFGREDVETIFALREGNNKGPDWVCVGRLSDGRYFVIRAGCDYTGWG